MNYKNVMYIVYFVWAVSFMILRRHVSLKWINHVFIRRQVGKPKKSTKFIGKMEQIYIPLIINSVRLRIEKPIINIFPTLGQILI